eukprot:m.263034 g.263034  ORF g.263034 m.263034 type:complete len:64 (+) comp15597_c0_seq10:2306-2497(+)
MHLSRHHSCIGRLCFICYSFDLLLNVCLITVGYAAHGACQVLHETSKANGYTSLSMQCFTGYI